MDEPRNRGTLLEPLRHRGLPAKADRHVRKSMRSRSIRRSASGSLISIRRNSALNLASDHSDVIAQGAGWRLGPRRLMMRVAAWTIAPSDRLAALRVAAFGHLLGQSKQFGAILVG